MTTLTLQVTEVLFDFDDEDFTPEEQQAVVDTTLGDSLRLKLMMLMMIVRWQML
jgi:hypothetical protein